jgi:hypothetical protein
MFYPCRLENVNCYGILLFFYKQVYDIDEHGWDDKGNITFYDVLTL